MGRWRHVAQPSLRHCVCTRLHRQPSRASLSTAALLPPSCSVQPDRVPSENHVHKREMPAISSKASGTCLNTGRRHDGRVAFRPSACVHQGAQQQPTQQRPAAPQAFQRLASGALACALSASILASGAGCGHTPWRLGRDAAMLCGGTSELRWRAACSACAPVCVQAACVFQLLPLLCGTQEPRPDLKV